MFGGFIMFTILLNSLLSYKLTIKNKSYCKRCGLKKGFSFVSTKLCYVWLWLLLDKIFIDINKFKKKTNKFTVF